MNTLTRFEPRYDLSRDFFPDMFRRLMRGTDWPAMHAAEDMRLNVSETEKEYLVRAEIPGAKKEDIHVNIEGNSVSIDAEIKEERQETRKDDGQRVLLQETRYGRMSRQFTLPLNVEAKGANARFEDGVLSIALPKCKESAGTSIAVK